MSEAELVRPSLLTELLSRSFTAICVCDAMEAFLVFRDVLFIYFVLALVHPGWVLLIYLYNIMSGLVREWISRVWLSLRVVPLGVRQ